MAKQGKRAPSYALNTTPPLSQVFPEPLPPCHSVVMAPEAGHRAEGTAGVLGTLDTWGAVGQRSQPRIPEAGLQQGALGQREEPGRAWSPTCLWEPPRQDWKSIPLGWGWGGGVWSRAGLANSIKGQATTSGFVGHIACQPSPLCAVAQKHRRCYINESVHSERAEGSI